MVTQQHLLFCIIPSYRSRYHLPHTTTRQTTHIIRISTSQLFYDEHLSISCNDLMDFYSQPHTRDLGWVLCRICFGICIRSKLELISRFPLLYNIIEEVFEQSPWMWMTKVDRYHQVGQGVKNANVRKP